MQGQYKLVGQAEALGDNCYLLTPDQESSFGAIWSEEKIDLRFDFRLNAQVSLGDNKGGADGITFAFQQQSNSSGGAGGGLGISGVQPSIIFEMDTYQNELLDDPKDDHIALFKHGDLKHQSSNALGIPQNALSGGDNIDNGEFYELDIEWLADAQRFKIIFNCGEEESLPLIYEGDLIKEIFNNDSEVFWGFTAATGGKSNEQKVCFNTLIFDQQETQHTICAGGQVTLHATEGSSYLWTNSASLSANNIANPIASPDTNTIYEVFIENGCTQYKQSFEVFVTDKIIEYDLGNDTTVCISSNLIIGYALINATYQWSTGDTDPFLSPLNSGTYSVTLNLDETCKTEDKISVRLIEEPKIDIGRDTLVCEQSLPFLISNNEDKGNFIWNTGAITSNLEITKPGLYALSMSNICGEASGEIKIEIENCRNVYIPNIINLNSVENNAFTIFSDDDIFSIKVLNIYDRWGNLIFQNKNFKPNELSSGWNLSLHSSEPQTGVFVYNAAVIFKDGKEESLSGNLTVIK